MTITVRQVLFGLLFVAAASAGGAAVTASNTLPSTTAGYGTSTVSGAVATSIVFTLNADGTQITQADLVFTGDLTSGRAVSAAFGSDSLTTCTIGSYDGSSTAVSCSGFTQATDTATAFHVAVTNT